MCVGLRYPREDQEEDLVALAIESGKVAVWLRFDLNVGLNVSSSFPPFVSLCHLQAE